MALFIVLGTISMPAGRAIPQAGPTAESVLAAEEGLAKAFTENNADAIQSYLVDNWAVIDAWAEINEGSGIFPKGIRSGFRTLKTFDISEPRVRVYGDAAVVTFKLHLAGQFAGKPFDVMERESDVWIWKDGRWKCVLSHETLFRKDEKKYVCTDEKDAK
ncbi:MAG TPA: nuclear transport factor 2 family protein [Candidatus Acidoferrales bacterium]|nr:nuclear transport factor 2 family protein [Candidatus Acidoferrales bacterium]